MADEAKVTQDAEVPAQTEQKAEEGTETTIAKVLGTEEPKKEDSVPMAVFLEEKKGRKALEKKVKELEEAVANGSKEEQSEVSDEIDALGEQYNVDKNFLRDLKKSIKGDDSASKRLERLEQREREERFNSALSSALDGAPEYKEVVNKDVLKELAMLPKNANKTFEELLQETYGSAIRGKRTIETTKPRGGKSPDSDFDPKRLKDDPEYMDEIESNPKLKEKYSQYVQDIAGR